MSHLRIESHQKVVTDAKIIFVDGDREVDISSCVQVVDVHLGVGEVAIATLRAKVGHASMTVDAQDVLTDLERLPRRRKRSWRRRLREVTAIGSRSRSWS